MKIKIIEKSKNLAETIYCLAQLPNEKFGVFVLSHNYIRGKIVADWRYSLKDVDEETARKHFIKKLKGKIRR